MTKITNPVSHRKVNIDSSLGKVIAFYEGTEHNYRPRAKAHKKARKSQKRAIRLQRLRFLMISNIRIYKMVMGYDVKLKKKINVNKYETIKVAVLFVFPNYKSRLGFAIPIGICNSKSGFAIPIGIQLE